MQEPSVLKLRAGLVGLGIMGRHHARVMSSIEDVNFVGAYDKLMDANEIDFQGMHTCRSLEELISRNIDYAVVAVPTEFHLPVIKELASHGINVLIEKPLSQSLDTAKEIKSVCQNIIAGIGHVERFNPAISEARNRLEMLGDIFQIITSRQGPNPQRVKDVGVVYDLATHDIDATSWITNSSYKSLSARTKKHLGGDHEDLVSVVASLNSEIIVNHSVNWLSPFKERLVTITGEKGALEADMLTGDLTFFANGTKQNLWEENANLKGVTVGDVIKFSYNKKEPLLIEHENFRNLLLGKNSTVATIDDGINTIKVADAILESSETKKVVTLEYEK